MREKGVREKLSPGRPLYFRFYLFLQVEARDNCLGIIMVFLEYVAYLLVIPYVIFYQCFQHLLADIHLRLDLLFGHAGSL